MKKKFGKILIANRGEIACRIISTCKKIGIKTVSIYSEIDKLAPHVTQSDEAFLVGTAPSSESYLQEDKIIAIALKTGTDAIHPGYGFLSENTRFADKCQKAGIIFIGPSAETIALMGDKLQSKRAVLKFDVPLIPGTNTALNSAKEALAYATEIGYPVALKASAGGGGKGIRIVWEAAKITEEFALAKSESLAAFGDDSIFIEKYISRPKHIEVQILADQQGNILHLGDRECSIQRRNQKLIEEAPSPSLDDQLRKDIITAAIKVAKACGYYSAGTVEFILDENQNFYFLEMNTRLQVEHPVTEYITGIDLVSQMIKIAEGRALPFQQSDIKTNGHAIELRICAESPEEGFLPDTGILEDFTLPALPYTRLDSGYQKGMEVTTYYDPLIAKLICYGQNRIEVIQRLKNAISLFSIKGVKTTLSFGKFVLTHPTFLNSSFTTRFVENYYLAAEEKTLSEEELICVFHAMSTVLKHESNKIVLPNLAQKERSLWQISRKEKA